MASKRNRKSHRTFHRKSQISIEYVMLIGMAFIMATVAIYVITGLYTEKNYDKVTVAFNDFADTIRSELIIASQVNDGYVRNITLPQNIEGIEYNISINSSMLAIYYQATAVKYKVPATFGNFSIGINTISKNNGIVYIN